MKKCISILLTVLLLTAMIPVSAFAVGTLTVTDVTDSEGISLNDGDTIATVEGELILAFEDGAAIEQADLDAISITTVGGDFKSAVAASVDTVDSAKVHVRFGRLEEGADYTLSVPAAEYEFNFNAETEYHTNTDFSDTEKYPLYDAETGVQEAITNFTDSLGHLKHWTGYTTEYSRVYKTGDGDSYLAISPSYGANPVANTYGLSVCAEDADGNDFIADGNFNSTKNVNNDKVYVFEAGIYLYEGGTGATGILGKPSGVTNANTTMVTWNDGIKANNLGLSEKYTMKTAYDSGIKWREPRIVLRRGTDGKLYQDLYDLANNNCYIGTNVNPTAANVHVQKIGIGTEYLTTKQTTREYKYTYVKAYPERLLTVIKPDSYVGGEEKTLVIHMSDEFNEDSVNADSITVTRSDGAVMENVDITADSYERTITLTFPDGLRKGNYSIETNGLIGSNGLAGCTETVEFEVDKANGIEYYETANYGVTDSDGNPVDDISDVAQVTVSVDVISDEGNAFTMALVICDANNRVMKIVTGSAAVGEGDTSVTLSVSTPDGINIGDGCTVRPLVWLDDSDAGAIFIEEFEKLTALSAQ